MDMLTAAFFLAAVVKALLDYISLPLLRRWPQLDLWWFDYLALGVGAVIAWLAGLDLFRELLPQMPPALSRVLSALIVGGGARLLNEVFQPAISGRGGLRRGW